jgi:GNAT superfamily N-acetyltransferase
VIKKIAFKDLLPIMDDMKKDGILLSEKATSFGYYDGELLVAVTGVILGKKAYFKMLYTIPSMRKKGILHALLSHTIKYAKNNGAKSGYANCTKQSLNAYLSFGGNIAKQYKNGITRVEYANL